MRIAIEASWACRQPTGIGFYARGLLAGLAQLDTDDEFLLMHWTPAWNGGDYGPRFIPQCYRRGTAFTSVVMGLPEALRKAGGVEVFHATAATGVPPVMSLPCVATIHDLFRLRKDCPDAWVEKLKFRIMLKWSLRNSQHFICNSAATAGALRGLSRYAGQPITVTHLAGAGCGDPVSGRRERPRHLLCIGGIERRKGQLFLLQVYAELRRRVPDLPPLIFIGPDRGDGERLRQGIVDAGLSGMVEWRGYVDDAMRDALLDEAWALLMPSREEGFGLPVVEAMSRSVPVMASDIPVFREVAGADSALLVPAHDVGAWGEAVRRLLYDEELREKLAAEGQRNAERFSWREMARQTLEVYRDVKI